MSLPGTYSLALYRGDTDHWQFKLWTNSQKTQPADLTGCTASAEIRDAPDGTLASTLVCDITAPNIIDVSIDAAEWTNWPPEIVNGVWDLQVTYPTGDIKTVIAGRVTVTQDVTL